MWGRGKRTLPGGFATTKVNSCHSIKANSKKGLASKTWYWRNHVSFRSSFQWKGEYEALLSQHEEKSSIILYSRVFPDLKALCLISKCVRKTYRAFLPFPPSLFFFFLFSLIGWGKKLSFPLREGEREGGIFSLLFHSEGGGILGLIFQALTHPLSSCSTAFLI